MRFNNVNRVGVGSSADVTGVVGRFALITARQYKYVNKWRQATHSQVSPLHLCARTSSGHVGVADLPQLYVMSGRAEWIPRTFH
jgi:hypothetical protein